jgi:hypothetical protein
MTTSTYSTVIDHSNDAGFRAWGSELSTALSAVGLVQTADTGQINWATATRPGTSTAAGYEIYRFDDALQGTAPIYFKLEYGTSSSATTIPQLWLTIGTGSNGSGTITDEVVARTVCATSAAAPNTAVPYPSYVCNVDGQLMVCSKTGAGPSSYYPGMFWHIGRTTDDSGDATADGVVFYYRTSATGFITQQCRLFASGSSITTAAGSFCLVPGLMTASMVGSDIQVFKNYAAFPLVSPNIGVVTVITAEVPAGNTISVAAVGSTPRTYISIGQAGYGCGVTNSTNYCAAILWE